MPNKNVKKPPAKPYPYDLPLVEKLRRNDASFFKQTDPWDALEFFRVEALLRSSKFQKMYATGSRVDLLWKYGGQDFYRCISDGIHERFLKPHKPIYLRSFGEIGRGVTDLSGEVRSDLNRIRQIEWASSAIKEIGKERLRKWETKKWVTRFVKEILSSKRYAFLKIDNALPVESIIKVIRPYLHERQKKHKQEIQNDVLASGYWQEVNPSNPPITNIKAWLDYFACYDVKIYTGISFGLIARKIYRNVEHRERAEKAFDRVSRLIHYAEENHWPPPSGFFNLRKSS